MSAGPQVLQSEPQPPSSRAWPTDEESYSPALPITPEDLAKLGVDAQLIPFIVSTTSQIERSPNGPPPLGPVEAENLVEILDKVHHTA